MINIMLYKTNDDENVINKEKELLNKFQISFIDDTDVVNPVITLNVGKRVEIDDFNYCYITNLKRYYFIDSYQFTNETNVKLSLSCDVLETFKSEILNSNARYSRKIKTGDYPDIPIDRQVLSEVDIHKSNVTIEENQIMILSTIGEVKTYG